MLKREVESWVYNLMLAVQVECWGLKLIFGSLSWIINFECWNVKLKVECYNLMLAGQVECWGLKLIFGGDWTPYIGSAEIFHRVYSTSWLVLSPLQYDQPSNRTWITLTARLVNQMTTSSYDNHLIIRQESVYRNTFETSSSYDNNFFCLTSCFVLYF